MTHPAWTSAPLLQRACVTHARVFCACACAGPYKQARSISIAPQLRFFFFRESFGLPQSPRQVLQFLLDPTLQLVGTHAHAHHDDVTVR
jgi:hypothetical protein